MAACPIYRRRSRWEPNWSLLTRSPKKSKSAGWFIWAICPTREPASESNFYRRARISGASISPRKTGPRGRRSIPRINLEEVRLLSGRQRVVLRKIHVLPFAVHNFFADLCRGFSGLGFGVGKDRLLLAQNAMRGVSIHVTIEQALVPDFLVAAAVTRLLVQDCFFLGGQRVNILRLGVGELLGVQSFGQRIVRARGVVGRNIRRRWLGWRVRRRGRSGRIGLGRGSILRLRRISTQAQ